MGAGAPVQQSTTPGGKGGSIPQSLNRMINGTSEDDYKRFMSTVRFAPGAEIPTYEQWRDQRLARQQNQPQPQQTVTEPFTQNAQSALTVAPPVRRRPDPIMPTMMGQPTPAPEASATSQAEPTLTPSQLMGVVQSMGGKGGFGYSPPSYNPYAGQGGKGGFGYRPPTFNPYAGQGGFGYQPMSGGKGGYSAPSYNPYATQSPYVNYNQPSYGAMGGKGGSIGGKGGTAGGKGG